MSDATKMDLFWVFVAASFVYAVVSAFNGHTWLLGAMFGIGIAAVAGHLIADA